MKTPIVSIFLLILMGFSFNAHSTTFLTVKTDSAVCIAGDTLTFSSVAVSPARQLKEGDEQKKKRRISALFAFPFPFGFVGAHRVMLGTKPWIPVVYVATFGGCFGVLPLIDFCVIAFSKDIEQYENNPQLFMWVK